MKRLFFRLLALCLIVLFSEDSYGQINEDSLVNAGMTLELKHDTLLFSTGLKLYEGEKMVVGTAAGAEGYSRFIIYENAALVPSIWGQDMRYQYAIENHVNKKKSREKVKNALPPGTLLTIKKISFCKTGKPYFYLVSLLSGKDKFYADIRMALISKELLLQH